MAEIIIATATTRLLSAAGTTNSTLVKNSAARLCAIQGLNVAAAIRFLKLYNLAVAPVVGTDTPIKTIAIPASSAFVLTWPTSYLFSVGLGFGLTVNGADADATAVTAGDIVGLNIDYQ